MSNVIFERRVKRGWMKLEVKAVHRVTKDTVRIELIDAETKGREFDFTPGQYLTFRFDGLEAKPIVRSYSLSSAPSVDQDSVSFTVKAVERGQVSHYLSEVVKPGDMMSARGPMGNFCYRPGDPQRLVMIGAGSGITPFLSMVEEYNALLGSSQGPSSMVLVGTFRHIADIIGSSVFRRSYPQTKARLFLSQALSLDDSLKPYASLGRLTPSGLDKSIESYEDTIFLSCGPQGFMEMVDEHLARRGVEESMRRRESFS